MCPSETSQSDNLKETWLSSIALEHIHKVCSSEQIDIKTLNPCLANSKRATVFMVLEINISIKSKSENCCKVLTYTCTEFRRECSECIISLFCTILSSVVISESRNSTGINTYIDIVIHFICRNSSPWLCAGRNYCSNCSNKHCDFFHFYSMIMNNLLR